MTKPIQYPTAYKHCIITPTKLRGGFDVFESSGRWFHVKTQKQAKWWASIASRIQDEFGANRERPVPTPVEDHTPKPKTKE